MSLDAVLKVGGSLSRCDKSLSILCREISRLSQKHSLVVVPGGGEFADQVREAYMRYKLDETAAHHMALLAMDQFGYILNSLIAGSSLITDLDSALQAAESGHAAVLLPSAPVMKADPLPHSWRITSDTIAAWVAHRAFSRRLILLKNVDGLLSAKPADKSPVELIAELTVEKLAEHAGGVDEYLSRILATINLETWVINGLRPERLSQLLCNDHTTGTRIKPGFPSCDT